MGVKRGKRDSVYIQPQVSKKPEMTSRERARKASRDLKKELTDTTGGSKRSLKREHLIIKWILRITHLDKDMSIDFADRIKEVQTQILAYGVEQKYMFKIDDILRKKNTPKVIRCLEEVAKLSRHETHIKLDTLLSNKLYT